MKRVTDELRAAYQSLSEVEGDQPGHDFDRGYLTGWHDERRHIRRLHPDGGFREPSRVAEFRLGYRQGRDDAARNPKTGLPRTTDWWPDVALGRMDPDTNEPIAGTGAAGLADAIARAASRAALTEKTARAAAETPVAASRRSGAVDDDL
jgi:hypothetical protein